MVHESVGLADDDNFFLYSVQRAFRQYEQAMGAAANMADRMAQMESMDGAARCLETLRLQVRNFKNLTVFFKEMSLINFLLMNDRNKVRLSSK